LPQPPLCWDHLRRASPHLTGNDFYKKFFMFPRLPSTTTTTTTTKRLDIEQYGCAWMT
jgi:hypothetical protein